MQTLSLRLFAGVAAALSLAACVVSPGPTEPTTSGAQATTGTPAATAPTAATPTATAPATATATAPATATARTAPTTLPVMTNTAPTNPPAPGAKLSGTWESASCGGRAYVRRISFGEAPHFTAVDLVSPCPPKAQCIWSGIVNREGTYTVTGTTVALTVSKAGNGPGAQSFPATLTLDASNAPIETGSDGKLCVYKLTPQGATKP